MKVIKYKFLSCEVNRGTEENPDIEKTILSAKIECETLAQFDANYAIAEKEAIPGTIEVVGEFDKEPATLTVEERLTILENDVVEYEEYVSGTWYYRGNRVLFNNSRYTCIAPAGVVCVWSPEEFTQYWQKDA